MNDPKFSIIIPTKNRHQIVGEAVYSALHQRHDSFEVIVMNNDDEDETGRVLSVYEQNPRLKYYRTGGLTMSQNWEEGLARAKGEYVIILEDKMRLVLDALLLIDNYLPADIVTFGIKPTHKLELDSPPYMSFERVNSSALLDDFLHCRSRFFNYAPKGINSCVRRDILQSFRCAFAPENPDYTVAFQLLDKVPRLIILDKPLVYIPNNWFWSGKYSNGQQSYRNTKELWIDSVIRDYRKFVANPKEMDRVSYLGFCYYLLVVAWKLRIKTPEHRARLKVYCEGENRLKILLNFLGRFVR